MTEHLRTILQAVAQSLGLPFPEGILIEEPPAHIGGDFSCNVAMQLAKAEKRSPRDIATQLAEALQAHPDIASVEVAGPGFFERYLGRPHLP